MPDPTPSPGPVDLDAAEKLADEAAGSTLFDHYARGIPIRGDAVDCIRSLVSAVRDRDRGIEELRAMAGRAESLRDAAIRRAEAAEYNDREIRKHLGCRIEAADRNAAQRDALIRRHHGPRPFAEGRPGGHLWVVTDAEGKDCVFEDRGAADRAARRAAGLEEGGER